MYYLNLQINGKIRVALERIKQHLYLDQKTMTNLNKELMKNKTIIIVIVAIFLSLAIAFTTGILVGRMDYKKQVDKANFFYNMAEDCI